MAIARSLTDAEDEGITAIERGMPGSTLDGFLAEEGLLEEATDRAIRSVLAWQISETPVDRDPSKAAVDRELPPG